MRGGLKRKERKRSMPRIHKGDTVIVISGKEKRATLDQEIEQGEASELPIARFIAQLKTNLTVYEGP